MTTPAPWSMKKPCPISRRRVDLDPGQHARRHRQRARDDRDAEPRAARARRGARAAPARPGHDERISALGAPRAAGSRACAAATSRRTSPSTRDSVDRPSMLRRVAAPLSLLIGLSRGAKRLCGATARRTASRRSARPSPAGRPRSACRATPAGGRPRSPPTAPRRTRCRRARPRCARRRARVSSASSSSTAMTSSMISRLSTGGTKPAPMPWILCGPGERPDSTAERRRLDRDDVQLRVALLQHLARARDRAARPDAADEHVDVAVERVPQLRAGRAAVRLGVGGVGELVGQEDVVALGHVARGLHRLVHPAHRLDDLHARAVHAQQRLALAAHALRQRQHEVVALRGADERERDAGVARGRLDDRRACPARSSPPASAASIIATPMRSLTLPPGLKDSSLPNSRTPSGAIRASSIIGVRPTCSAMLTGIRAIGVTPYPARRCDGARRSG